MAGVVQRNRSNEFSWEGLLGNALASILGGQIDAMNQRGINAANVNTQRKLEQEAAVRKQQEQQATAQAIKDLFASSQPMTRSNPTNTTQMAALLGNLGQGDFLKENYQHLFPQMEQKQIDNGDTNALTSFDPMTGESVLQAVFEKGVDPTNRYVADAGTQNAKISAGATLGAANIGAESRREIALIEQAIKERELEQEASQFTPFQYQETGSGGGSFDTRTGELVNLNTPPKKTASTAAPKVQMTDAGMVLIDGNGNITETKYGPVPPTPNIDALGGIYGEASWANDQELMDRSRRLIMGQLGGNPPQPRPQPRPQPQASTGGPTIANAQSLGLPGVVTEDPKVAGPTNTQEPDALTQAIGEVVPTSNGSLAGGGSRSLKNPKIPITMAKARAMLANTPGATLQDLINDPMFIITDLQDQPVGGW